MRCARFAGVETISGGVSMDNYELEDLSMDD